MKRFAFRVNIQKIGSACFIWHASSAIKTIFFKELFAMTTVITVTSKFESKHRQINNKKYYVCCYSLSCLILF